MEENVILRGKKEKGRERERDRGRRRKKEKEGERERENYRKKSSLIHSMITAVIPVDCILHSLLVKAHDCACIETCCRRMIRYHMVSQLRSAV